eukprot:TRINITY_DN891_c0_g1_i3.p1 TRINITY_DN891_c0_g1~~TRINITY_DN891_c0_g1_i3.p1  ORF type:complete len:288 (+),score=36.77 TRINITY_DN891_c0_g1_i3:463-1326(+)
MLFPLEGTLTLLRCSVWISPITITPFLIIPNCYSSVYRLVRVLGWVAEQIDERIGRIRIILRYGQGPRPTFVTFFSFGSIVVFNVPAPECQEYVEVARRHMSVSMKEELREDRLCMDDYQLLVVPDQQEPVVLHEDRCSIQSMNDMHAIRIVSAVLGQSVAMNVFEEWVNEKLLRDFTPRGVNHAHTLSVTDAIRVKFVMQLGLLDRNETAWKYRQYDSLLEYLRKEFEITERFEALRLKVELVMYRSKLGVEMGQARTSNHLELAIIFLISVEIAISVFPSFMRDD